MKYIIDIDLDNPRMIFGGQAYYDDLTSGISWVISDRVKDKLIPLKQTVKEELIRCKDCKWCVEHYDTDENAPYGICKNWYGGTDADGFCYEAERRSE